MPSHHKLRWFHKISLLLGLVLLSACQSDTQQQMPKFLVKDLARLEITDETLRGKVTVINFWATSCSTCVKEMPELIKTYQMFKGNQFEMVAIAMSYDPPMYVANFAQTRQLPFRVALDSDGSASKAFGKIQLTPTTLVIDKSGRIIKRFVGEPEWESFHKLLEKALAEKV